MPQGPHLAWPEVFAKAGRRENWTITEVTNPNTARTNNEDHEMYLPEGDDPIRVAIRTHESLHAAHSPDSAATFSTGHKMAEEVRMDALAHIAGLPSVLRHDMVEPSAMRAGNDPKGAVAWYWQFALTLGSLDDVKRGRIRPRADISKELRAGFNKVNRGMGALAPVALQWVRKLLAEPTAANVEAAGQWWEGIKLPAPSTQSGAGTPSQQSGDEGDDEDAGGGSSGSSSAAITKSVMPGICGGTVGEVSVTISGTRDYSASKRLQHRLENKQMKQSMEIGKAQSLEAAKQQAALELAAPNKSSDSNIKRQGKKDHQCAVGRIVPFSRSLIHDHLKDGHGTPVKLRRGTRQEGSTVLRPERWRPGDRSVFSARRRGGALAIDFSGSMNWRWNVLQAAVAEMPGLTILGHGGNYSQEIQMCLLADRGRFVADIAAIERACRWGSGNFSDIEALQWLALQRGPRIWLSDGEAHSGQIAYLANHGMPYKEIAERMVRIAAAADITRVRRVEDALAICRHQKTKGTVVSARLNPEAFLVDMY